MGINASESSDTTLYNEAYRPHVLVAVFTLFDEDSKKQSQVIAYSEDGGRTCHYYDRNPVIDIWSTEFRDPTVIRYEHIGKEVMAVTKPLDFP